MEKMPRASRASASQAHSSQEMFTSTSPMKAGAVVSSMVKVAVVSLLFPQSSVAVNVTVTAPVAAQRSLSVASLWLQVTALQLSLASAPPLSASQAAGWSPLPAPSHSTVKSAATRSMVGLVVSSTVMSWSQLIVAGLSQWSMASAVHVRMKLYWPSQRLVGSPSE